MGARSAIGAVAQDAIAAGKAALASVPPQRAAARDDFTRALASAGDDASALAEAHLRLATLDEEDGDFASAREHDRACVAAAPVSRWGRTAKAREGWLSERAEGAFAPLARLSRAWGDAKFLDDAASVDAFAREAESFPPGTVRGEARLLLAESWLHHLHRADDGKRELLRVRDDPSSSPRSVISAERELADELLAEGRLDAAEDEIRARGPQLEPAFAAKVEERLARRARRRALGWGSAGLAALCVAAFCVAWARRRISARDRRGPSLPPGPAPA
jgi:hypothetical protein